MARGLPSQGAHPPALEAAAPAPSPSKVPTTSSRRGSGSASRSRRAAISGDCACIDALARLAEDEGLEEVSLPAAGTARSEASAGRSRIGTILAKLSPSETVSRVAFGRQLWCWWKRSLQSTHGIISVGRCTGRSGARGGSPPRSRPRCTPVSPEHPEPMPTLQVTQVTKAFGQKRLFEDVDVAFPEHNRYGLTGPNGAGKTTFMKILAGERSPTPGRSSDRGSLGPPAGPVRVRGQARPRRRAQGNQTLWAAIHEKEGCSTSRT